MSLQTRLSALITAIGADIKSLDTKYDSLQSKIILDGGATPTELYDEPPPSDGIYAAPNHSHPYLSVTGKAADSDKLDGLDSTAFLLVGAKAADSNLLDGIDSTGFATSGHGHTLPTPAQIGALPVAGKAADSELLDGLNSTEFARSDVIARAVKRQNAHGSGGGNLSWNGSTLSGSQRYIWIPSASGQGGHWNLEDPSAWSISNITPWSIVYYRATDAQWTASDRLTITPAMMSIVGYGSYVPHENDLVLGVHNGDSGDGQFYFNDGRVIAPSNPMSLDVGWTYLPPISPFTPYQSTLGQEWTPRYKRKGGLVFVEGLVNGTPGGLIATLPSGFRPGTGTLMRNNIADGNTGWRMDVTSSGSISFVGGNATGSWRSIACVFPQEN